MFEVKTCLRVRYAETDAMGIAYHASYLVWFEVGRSEYFREMVGEDPGGFFRQYGMPLLEASVRYHSPCRYDDLLTVWTTIDELRSRTIKFRYRVTKDETLVATGNTLHVCVDTLGNPCRIPNYLIEALKEAVSRT